MFLTPACFAAGVRGTVAALGIPAVTAAVALAGVPATQAAATPGWRVTKTVAVANASLDDVVATSSTDAWAVGTGDAGTGTPVYYHWNGKTWQKFTRPGPAGSFGANVSASSPSNVWVSVANGAVFDHWNGSTWTTKSFGTSDTASPDAVVTTGPKNVWAFTYDFNTSRETAHHFNGTVWKDTVLPASIDGAGLTGLVSASSAANIWAWAVGTAPSSWETLHYNGTKWSIVHIPANLVPSGKTFEVKEMLAESPTNVWATTTDFGSGSDSPIVLLHWNGHKWSKVTKNVPAGLLLGPIASDGGSGLWLCAESPSGTPFFAHYLAGTWTRAKVPSVTLGSVLVAGLRLIPGTHSVWGVGEVGAGGGGTKGAAILKFGP